MEKEGVEQGPSGVGAEIQEERLILGFELFVVDFIEVFQQVVHKEEGLDHCY